MTLKELNLMLKGIGLPYAYDHFPSGTEQVPPFICFLLDRSNDFLADDINYQSISELSIELYSDTKNFELEKTVEAVLTSNGFVFSREETWLDSEQMNMVVYTTNIVITEET